MRLTEQAFKLLRILCYLLLHLTLPLNNAHTQTIVPGAVAGSMNVSDSGAAGYTIPLSVPPGTGDLAPKLALTYSSAAPSGLMGPGWALSGLSTISRCAADIPTDGHISGVSLTTSDRFCLDGQKLIAVAGTYGANGTEYRTHVESFSRIFSYGQLGNGPAYFTVELKSGLKMEFGNTADSRLRSTSPTVLGWNVNKVSDRSGNFYTVGYFQDINLGFTAPAQIDYTGNAAAGVVPYNSIVIEYEGRTIGKDSFLGGERFAIQHRIKRLSTYSSGTLAMRYSVAYDHEPISKEDRVISISQCSGSNECFPLTTFDWTAPGSTPTMFSPGQFYNGLSAAQGLSQAHENPIYAADFNGDGLTDLARVRSNDTAICYNALQTGFSSCHSLPDFGQQTLSSVDNYPMTLGDWTGAGRTGFARIYPDRVRSYKSEESTGTLTQLPDLFALSGAQGYNDQARDPLITLDLNGDGRTDLARGHLASNSLFHINFHLATGSGFSPTAASTLTITNPNNYYPYMFSGDWDGDGLGDFGVTWEDRPTGTNSLQFYRSTGTGFVPFQTIPQPLLSPNDDSFNSIYSTILIGDWNADGLTDFGIVGHYGIKFYRATGSGFQYWMELQDLGREQLGSNLAATIYEYPFEVGDWNGDGRSDFARITTGTITFYVAHANGFEHFYSLPDLTPGQGYGNTDSHPVLLGDWNGDGFTDIGRVSDTGVKLYLGTNHSSLQIARITDGLGKSIEFEYGLLTDPAIYTKGSGASYPLVDLQMAGEVLSETKVSNGLGSFASTTYKYSDLRFNAARRSSLGFGAIAATDETTGITTKTFYKQDFPFEGQSFRTERRLPSGVLVERNTDTWSSISIPSGTVMPFVSTALAEQFETNGTLAKSSATINTLDTFGNLTLRHVVHSDQAYETTVSSYTNDQTNWLIGQLTTTAVTSRAGGVSPAAPVTRTTAFSYMPVRGLLLTETIEPNNSQFTTAKSYTYDLFGNITSTSVSGANITTRTSSVGYDQYGRFALTGTNPLGHVSTTQRSPLTGQVTSATDPNGLTAVTTYDSFGRPVHKLLPDGTYTSSTILWPDSAAPSNSAYQVHTTSSGSPDSTTYFDELGREIRRSTLGFGGRVILIDKVYNDRGAVSHVSEPYFFGDPIYWTYTDYDLLGRVILTVDPNNNQTAVAYNGLSTVTTNPLGQTRTEVVDAQGRLVTVTDNLGGVLRIKLDGRGAPLQTIDQLGNTTTIQYDLAGRRTAITDPDTGLTTFTYNRLGELISTTNALGQTTQYSYDLLSRTTARISSAGTESWTYDAAPNGIGKLSAVIGLGGFQAQLSYDQFGRTIQTATTISGVSYTSSQTYDQFSRPDTLTYPSGLQIQTRYDSLGYVSGIVQLPDRKTLWKPVSRNARGQLLEQRFGNGLSSTQQFHPQTSLIQRITTGSVQDLTFQHNALGDLTQRQDIARNLAESFVYDGLNRLTLSQVTGQAGITTSYNSIGNITLRSDVGSYFYPAAGTSRPHAVVSITGPQARTFGYNSIGQRTTSTGGTIQYSFSGHPTRITEGVNAVEFMLDPSDSRVVEKKFTGTTLIETKHFLLGGMYERVTAGTSVSHNHYIRGTDGLVALISSRQSGSSLSHSTRYLHLDHLGSIQTLTDDKGNIKEVNSFDSWGKRRDPYTWGPLSSTPKSMISRGFTGHEQLDTVRLIHMNGRVYDPWVGRFVSPDPVIEKATDMQSYNRYSYVLNNPLSLTDPTGHFSFRSTRKWVLRNSRMLLRQAAVLAATAAGAWLGGPAAGPFVSAYFANFTKSLMSGGGLGGSIRAGFDNIIVNGLRGYVDNIVGHGFSGQGGFSQYGDIGLALAHGVADAAFAAATGSSAREGFLSGFGGSLGGSLGVRGAGRYMSKEAAGYVGAALGGGTGAALGGGKFEDGAMRGAFIYLFNHSWPGLEQGVGEAIASYSAGGPQAAAMAKAVQERELAIANMMSTAVGYIDTVGEFSTQISSPLKYTAKGMFFVADRLGICGNIVRAPALLIGAVSLVGANPSSKMDALKQLTFMRTMGKQTLKFFSVGASSLAPQELPNIPQSGHGF